MNSRDYVRILENVQIYKGFGLKEDVPRLLGGVKSTLKSLEVPPVLPQYEASLVRLSDHDKLAHGTSNKVENDEYKSFDSGRSGISELHAQNFRTAGSRFSELEVWENGI